MRPAMRYLALFCFAVAVVCLAAFFGSCRDLVPGDAGGYHELGALGGVLIGAGAGLFFWRRAEVDARTGRIEQ